jgi:hypothetical protein
MGNRAKTTGAVGMKARTDATRHNTQKLSKRQTTYATNPETYLMNKTERLGVTMLCTAILGSQLGCLPGMRGGPPGLPGLPRAELPGHPEASAMMTSGNVVTSNHFKSIIKSEKSVNPI